MDQPSSWRHHWERAQLQHLSASTDVVLESESEDDYLQLFWEVLQWTVGAETTGMLDPDQLSLIFARMLASTLWRLDWCTRDGGAWREAVEQVGNRQLARANAFTEADDLYRIRQRRLDAVEQCITGLRLIRHGLGQPVPAPHLRAIPGGKP